MHSYCAVLDQKIELVILQQHFGGFCLSFYFPQFVATINQHPLVEKWAGLDMFFHFWIPLSIF